MMRSLWMRQLGALILKEFRQIVRDPSSYLVAGVLPLLFLFIFGFGISLDPGILQLAVLNQSGSMQSRSLEAAFANSPWFKTHPVRHMRDAEALMRDSAVQGVLVLHQDMDAALQRGISHRCPTGAHGAPSVDNRYSRSVKKKAAGRFLAFARHSAPRRK